MTKPDVISTASGYAFSYSGESTHGISISDIAQSLSRLPRFNGHTEEFYSVAQHSVLVSLLLEERCYCPFIQFVGLMHDATEAYTSDIPSPLKAKLPEYKAIENAVWDRICMYFFEMKLGCVPAVKEADMALLEIEQRQLFPNASTEVDWTPWFECVEKVPETWKIEPMEHKEARAYFLDQYVKLTKKVFDA